MLYFSWLLTAIRSSTSYFLRPCRIQKAVSVQFGNAWIIGGYQLSLPCTSLPLTAYLLPPSGSLPLFLPKVYSGSRQCAIWKPLGHRRPRFLPPSGPLALTSFGQVKPSACNLGGIVDSTSYRHLCSTSRKCARWAQGKPLSASLSFRNGSIQYVKVLGFWVRFITLLIVWLLGSNFSRSHPKGRPETGHSEWWRRKGFTEGWGWYGAALNCILI